MVDAVAATMWQMSPEGQWVDVLTLRQLKRNLESLYASTHLFDDSGDIYCTLGHLAPTLAGGVELPEHQASSVLREVDCNVCLESALLVKEAEVRQLQVQLGNITRRLLSIREVRNRHLQRVG